MLRATGRAVTVAAWIGVTAVALYFVRGLTIGDPSSASPLLWTDAPYNLSHKHIQDKFGGVEPLIVVAEGYDKDAMKDPGALRNMERFQRYLERDESLGRVQLLTGRHHSRREHGLPRAGTQVGGDPR